VSLRHEHFSAETLVAAEHNGETQKNNGPAESCR